MFSGIVEESASVAAILQRPQYLRLTVKSSLDHSATRTGDSIAIDGICLTVTAVHGDQIEFEAGSETVRRTTLEELQVGSRVNLERALRLGDRIHGHLVSGHIDGVTRLLARSTEGVTEKFVWELPAELKSLIALKGSVSISGVSLTVGEVSDGSFGVYVIPHTAQATTLPLYRTGRRANIEADILAHYVQATVLNYTGRKDAALLEKLEACGFKG